MRLTVTAPGKLILLGEYAVLEGAGSLVAAVDRYAQVTLQTSSAENCRLSSPTLSVASVPFSVNARNGFEYLAPISQQVHGRLEFVRKLLLHLFETYNPVRTNITPADITVTTDGFYHKSGSKLGLGSSAAMTVALSAGLRSYFRDSPELPPEKTALFQQSLDAHRSAQGKLGSGIDVAASTFGNVLCYRADTGENHRWEISSMEGWPEDLYLVTIWTGISVSTTRFVRRLQEFKREDFQQFRKCMGELAHLSEDGSSYFQRSRWSEFLETVDMYYYQLQRLGSEAGISIISEVHRHIGHIVRDAGGIYKPSGAGGGDIGVALTDHQTIRDNVHDRLSSEGYHLLSLSISAEGVHLTQQAD